MTDIEKELPERLAKAEDYMACGVFGSASAELLKAKNAQLTELRRQVASLKEAAEELADLVDHFREGSYQIDSFTTQPVRVALAELEQKKGE